MARFDGRIAVVTGGGKGLGEGIVRALAAEGARVYGVSAGDSAIRVAAEIGPGVEGRQCDVGDPNQLAALAAEIRTTHGRLDLLVNNAGVAATGARLHEIPVETWDRIMRTNLRGAFLTLRAFIPLMLDRGGSIVNMGSIGSIRPVAESGAYIVSKGAMVMLTRQAAIEYVEDGIRVNMVAPGPIMTPMVAAAGEEMIVMLAERSPMKRLGTVQEIAALTLFLLSDEAGYTTGAIYPAGGGREAL